MMEGTNKEFLDHCSAEIESSGLYWCPTSDVIDKLSWVVQERMEYEYTQDRYGRVRLMCKVGAARRWIQQAREYILARVTARLES